MLGECQGGVETWGTEREHGLYGRQVAPLLCELHLLNVIAEDWVGETGLAVGAVLVGRQGEGSGSRFLRRELIKSIAPLCLS